MINKKANIISKLYKDFDIVFTKNYEKMNSVNIEKYKLEIIDSITILLDINDINNVDKNNIYYNISKDNIRRLMNIVLITIVKHSSNVNLIINRNENGYNIDLNINEKINEGNNIVECNINDIINKNKFLCNLFNI